jgi:hypothetical protein
MKRRKAASATVEGTATRALPPPAPRLEIGPLDAPAGGSDDARAAFARDAGVPTAPAPAQQSEPGAYQQDANAAPPEVDAKASQQVVDDLTRAALVLLDGAGQVFGPKLGGARADWALDSGSTAAIEAAAKPVVAKYLSGNVTPEGLLLGTVACVYLPRVLAALAAKQATAPPSPPKQPEPELVTAEKDAAAPSPKASVTTIEAYLSGHA